MEETTPNLQDRFIHRDLSWLAFNERVLEEALDPANPLLERARFIAIFANNLDEFLMVRVAGLKRLIDSGHNRADGFGYYPQEIYSRIRARMAELTERAHQTYAQKLKPELEKNKIDFRKTGELTGEQKRFANKYFDASVFPICTPMAVDQAHPFPTLASKTMAFAVSLTRYDKPYLAVLPIPKALPRVLRLPSEKDGTSFLLIEDIIRQYLPDFFKGYKIAGHVLFRVIRDSELSVDEEYAPDLLKAIENEIKKRPKAKVVHLQLERSGPPELASTLCAAIDFAPEELSFAPDEIDLTYLFEVIPQVAETQLCFPSFIPAKIACENIFERIKTGDLLTHLPFQSFQTTADLIVSASRDPQVLGIKMNLYRTNQDSAIIRALKEAAANRKQVTVLVELKARFDEQNNINWARELEEAGCHVIYGIPLMKIHCKMALVVRQEEDRIRRYVHLSTGNYNEKTSQVYTDIGYLTANEDFAKDISDMFNVLSGYSMPSRWKRIVAAPNDMRDYFFDLIDAEIACQEKTKNGLIYAKMNALEDREMIEKLYEASRKGVKIRLLVRGICSLVPGVKDLSDNIEVRSLVGRFLEHSRVYVFNNNGEPRVFLSSADWMTRNLHRRVELLFEMTKEELKDHLQFIMETYWRDTAKTRALGPDRAYARLPDAEKNFNAQEFFIAHYTGSP